jgi:prolyl-tRNA editing enzyme YbaK/EbsC (Cys-tRNA(Pro) deacylase)
MPDLTDPPEPPAPSTPAHAAEHRNVERVVRAARERGLAISVRRFGEETRTAADAARAVGCDVAQIVKSLVFVADGEVVVALVSGADRLDAARLGAALGVREVRRATADEAREATGFAIGGIPPLGHDRPIPVLVDERLLAFDLVWAAAGLPDAVFAADPGTLARAAEARVATIAADREP